MKKIFVLSVLISVAMICSCQKQHASAEQQLAQRKAELDAREKGLDERENALLVEREKVLAEKDALAKKDASAKKDALAEKDTGESNAPTVSIGSRGQTAAAQLNARKNEVPAEVQPLVADPSQLIDAMDKADQARAARKQLELQQRAVMPAAQGNSPNASGP